jgi:hypothetical protein
MWAEKYTGFDIKSLRTDGGGEYVNDQFSTFLRTMGIERQVTVARTPQQNGVAERMNRTILEAARQCCTRPTYHWFWTYAVQAAVYLRNRSPTTALDNMTPYEAWRGEKPNLSHLRVFGCRAHMHLDKTKRSKLDARSIPVIFVGYSNEAKAWLVWDPAAKNRKAQVSRDVTFEESVAGSTLLTATAAAPAVANNNNNSAAVPAAELTDGSRSTIVDAQLNEDTESDSDSEAEPVEPARPRAAAEPTGQVSQPAVIPPPPASSAVSVPAAPPAVGPATRVQRRVNRELRMLSSYNALGNRERMDEQQHAEYCALAVQVGESISEPRTYQEAIRSPHRAQWEQAMQDELDSIKANSTFKLVPLPTGRQAIGSKGVHKINRLADGSIDRYKARYKARLAAKGCPQMYGPGADYTETYACYDALHLVTRHTDHSGKL